MSLRIHTNGGLEIVDKAGKSVFWSEETVKAALTAYTKFEPDKAIKILEAARVKFDTGIRSDEIASCIDDALDVLRAEKPKPYIFKAGDVVKGMFGIRIIVSIVGGLWAVDTVGWKICNGQTAFEGNMYVKIGELKDFLPKDENG